MQIVYACLLEIIPSWSPSVNPEEVREQLEITSHFECRRAKGKPAAPIQRQKALK
jgi:hypothetical protein